MKQPFDNYLKALIISRRTREEIASDLRENGLLAAGDFNAHIADLRRQISACSDKLSKHINSKARGRKKLPPASEIQKAIYDARVLVSPEHPDIEGALYILRYPMMRKVVEVLLIQGIPPTLIADEIEARFSIDDMATKVAAYSFLFWNVDALTPSDFSNWLDTIPLQDGDLGIHRQAMYAPPETVRALMGIRPNINISTQAEVILALGTYAFQRAMQNPQAELSQDAQSWFRYAPAAVTAAVRAKKELGDSGKSEQDTIADLKIELEEGGGAVISNRAELVHENERLLEVKSSQQAS